MTDAVRSHMPQAPGSLEETGVSPDFVEQLLLKTLAFSGEMTGSVLAERLGVRYTLIASVLEHLRKSQHVRIGGGGTVGGGPLFRYGVTEAGKRAAAVHYAQNQYVGPVPITLDEYTAYMAQCGRLDAGNVTPAAVKNAFSRLVLPSRVFDQLGPAIAAQHSLFIYGAPGNGKTVIAQTIRDALPADIAIPHAIVIDGHIIRVFDPVRHERIKTAAPNTALQPGSEDNRWVRCRRPVVTVGGELRMEALELGRHGAGSVHAPLQVVANGGVLVIDDFGRQRATPEEILNRWISPLESRVDYLTLPTGNSCEVPFQVLVVFATNLRPADLADEAFLRRIHYKVLVPSPTVDEFIQIFENYCREQQIEFDRDLAEHLVERELMPRHVHLRGVQPRDLIDHSLALAAYHGQPRVLTQELLAAACDSYFVDERELATA